MTKQSQLQLLVINTCILITSVHTEIYITQPIGTIPNFVNARTKFIELKRSKSVP